MGLFSRRNVQPADRYTYEIPYHVRNRLLNILFLKEEPVEFYHPPIAFEEVLHKLMGAYGKYHVSKQPVPGIPRSVDHFLECEDELVLDFFQLFFDCGTFFQGRSPIIPMMTARINRVFEEEGIGYELIDPVFETITETVERGYDREPTEQAIHVLKHPLSVIKKDERSTHVIAVQPALALLADARFITANKDLLDAFDEMKHGKYSDAVTSCGTAFESVMKIICDHKGWTYDKSKATCSDLVSVCGRNGLYHTFYNEMFVGIGRIRNKLGDAHGRGTAPEFHPANREEAEHMIATVCSHITFLIKQAKL